MDDSKKNGIKASINDAMKDAIDFIKELPTSAIVPRNRNIQIQPNAEIRTILFLSVLGDFIGEETTKNITPSFPEAAKTLMATTYQENLKDKFADLTKKISNVKNICAGSGQEQDYARRIIRNHIAYTTALLEKIRERTFRDAITSENKSFNVKDVLDAGITNKIENITSVVDKNLAGSWQLRTCMPTPQSRQHNPQQLAQGVKEYLDKQATSALQIYVNPTFSEQLLHSCLNTHFTRNHGSRTF